MSLIDRLERALGRFAISNLALYFVIGQVGVLMGTLLRSIDPSLLVLVPSAAMAGQWWRFLTFVFVPGALPSGVFGYVMLVFGWWMFYLMGNALEGSWGAFRFNLFILAGYVLTVGQGFVYPERVVSNLFLAGSVFLAFAYLNPDFELLLFFILPLKIKWIAGFTWVLFGYQFFVGGGAVRLQILAAVGNFLLFLGPDLWRAAGARRKGQAWRHAAAAPVRTGGDGARHRCRVCGKTDLTHPQMDFRYCSKCAGEACYCQEHIFSHEHLLTDEETQAKG